MHYITSLLGPLTKFLLRMSVPTNSIGDELMGERVLAALAFGGALSSPETGCEIQHGPVRY